MPRLNVNIAVVVGTAVNQLLLKQKMSVMSHQPIFHNAYDMVVVRRLVMRIVLTKVE